MKAAALHEFGRQLLVEEVPAPTPEPEEVLIEVETCGVCHSDLLRSASKSVQPGCNGAVGVCSLPGGHGEPVPQVGGHSRVNEALDRMRQGEIDGRVVLTKEEA